MISILKGNHRNHQPKGSSQSSALVFHERLNPSGLRAFRVKRFESGRSSGAGCRTLGPSSIQFEASKCGPCAWPTQQWNVSHVSHAIHGMWFHESFSPAPISIICPLKNSGDPESMCILLFSFLGARHLHTHIYRYVSMWPPQL